MATSHRDHRSRSLLPGGVSRRRFLAGAAGAGALAVAGGGIGARPARAATGGGGAAGMPGIGEVRGWQEQLVRFGTRYTGSPGHAAYVDWLASQFGAVPGFTVRTDRLTFNRWLAREYALRVRRPRVRRPVRPGAADLLLSLLGADPAGRCHRQAGRSGHLPARGTRERQARGTPRRSGCTGQGRYRRGPDRPAGVLAGGRADRHRRLRARQDVRAGRRGLRRLRRGAGASGLSGHLRARSAAGRARRRGARGHLRLDGAAR